MPYWITEESPAPSSRSQKTPYRRFPAVVSGHRLYSPTLARWINRDPIKEKGGKNLYVFAENNAVGYADVLGQYLLMYDPDPIKGCRFRFGDSRTETKDKSFADGWTERLTLEVKCGCSCPNDDDKYIMECSIVDFAVIRIDNKWKKGEWASVHYGVNGALESLGKLYGHEQHHIKGMRARIEKIILPMVKEREEKVYDGEGPCLIRAQTLETLAAQELARQLKLEILHNQENNQDTPPEAEPLDPIDGDFKYEYGE